VDHFTPKFKKAFEKVQEAAKVDQEKAKKIFRDEMVALGHEERIHNLYRVQDKLTKQAKFFRPNAPQERYLKTKVKRNVILKCRQVGFTTLNCIRALDYALWEPNSRSGILCHKLHTVKSIFNDITKFCYTWFGKDWGKLYKPVQKADSATSLSFEHDGLGRSLESSILVMHDFRGKTLHFLHVSEAGWIEEARLLGSVNGVPDNGQVTLESTANGQGNQFHTLWGKWRAKGKYAPYQGCFVPWYEYYPEQLEDWDFADTVDDWTGEELDLLEAYNGYITKENLLWRRWCIEAKCNGSVELFNQEYPTNDQDCFLANAASVFPYSVLKMHSNGCKDPNFLGNLTMDSKNVRLHQDNKGVVAIWENPKPSCTYSIGADPSGGVGKDAGAAYVKNQQTGQFVARLWGDLTPDDFAKELFKLATYYNRAWICVEQNNHGQVVLHVLSKEINYRNLYRRKTTDELTMKETRKLGFLTNSQSKLMLTEKFKTACKERHIVILDKNLISEMSTFVQVSSKTGQNVKRQAAQGTHDDLVMAACLTEEMASTRSAPTEDQKTRFDVIPDQVSIDPETGFIVGETA
jgi:hypothetical protein